MKMTPSNEFSPISTLPSIFLTLSLVLLIYLDSRMHMFPLTLNTHPMITRAKAGVFKPNTYLANAFIELSNF